MAVSQHTNCGLLIQFEQSCFVCVCVFFFLKEEWENYVGLGQSAYNLSQKSVINI